MLSADFYIQDIASGNSAHVAQNALLPRVGTPEHLKQSGAATRLAQVPNVLELAMAAGTAKFTVFKPILVPKESVNFLPDGLDVPKPELLYPLDSSIPYEVAEYLVLNYKNKFPNVEFSIDWTNNAANAVAYIRNGKKHVTLYGGLLRHRYIGVEAAGLVLAHELGHHFGGSPRYTQSGLTWASCEGQSDYWGALAGQRRVWWGPYAVEQTEKASVQLYNFFAYGLQKNLLSEPANAKKAGLCSHPTPTCRLETYRAGNTLADKPACAGDPSPYGVKRLAEDRAIQMQP